MTVIPTLADHDSCRVFVVPPRLPSLATACFAHVLIHYQGRERFPHCLLSSHLSTIGTTKKILKINYAIVYETCSLCTHI